MIGSEVAYFHGYTIMKCSTVLNKKGIPLKVNLRKRNGGKFDKRVRLYINGEMKHYTLGRLMLECFVGKMEGYETGHLDRDVSNCHLDNLERQTPSENQRHWRLDEKNKREKCQLEKIIVE